MRLLPLFAVIGGLAVLSAQGAEPEAWLDRMAKADQQSFDGAFIYERNGSFTTHAVWHAGSASGVRERLLQLDGPAQEVLRVDGLLKCMAGAFDTQVGEGQWPAWHLDSSRLSKYYDVRVLGLSRVAGRAATVLALIPRDQYRYAFELHLDDETALPLKSLLINEKGQLLERFQFVSLDIRSALDELALRPSEACKPVKASADVRVEQAWKATWLPPGFEFARAVRRSEGAASASVTRLLYGDGLASFSVFLEPLNGSVVDDARSQLGPTSVVSRRIATGAGDMMVTVVGEIPMGTAERVALSVQETTQ